MFVRRGLCCVVVLFGVVCVVVFSVVWLCVLLCLVLVWFGCMFELF